MTSAPNAVVVSIHPKAVPVYTGGSRTRLKTPSECPQGGRGFPPGPEQKLPGQISYLGLGESGRQAMHLSLVEAVSAVAALGAAFLIEVLVFVALGLI